jgi:hypothetical protein
VRIAYMCFQWRDGWNVWFLEANLRTALPRRLRFTSHQKIELIHKRFGLNREPKDIDAVFYGINHRRGGFFIALTDRLYERLATVTDTLNPKVIQHWTEPSLASNL